MSNAGLRFEDFISGEDIRSWSRAYYDWYGSIIFVRPDILQLELVIFCLVEPQPQTGNTYLWRWLSSDGQLVGKAREETGKPYLEDGELKIPFTHFDSLWNRFKYFSKLDAPLVEVLLDDPSRSQLLDALSNPTQRLSVLRWLNSQELPAYRYARSLENSKGVIEKVVLPPELDFIEEIG